MLNGSRSSSSDLTTSDRWLASIGGREFSSTQPLTDRPCSSGWPPVPERYRRSIPLRTRRLNQVNNFSNSETARRRATLFPTTLCRTTVLREPPKLLPQTPASVTTSLVSELSPISFRNKASSCLTEDTQEPFPRIPVSFLARQTFRLPRGRLTANRSRIKSGRILRPLSSG